MRHNNHTCPKVIITILLMFLYTAKPCLAAVPDSISNHLSDFDFMVQTTEKNYFAFPFIMQHGFGKEYKQMKYGLRKKVKKGKMGIVQATCEYAYWFFHKFDAHYYVDHPLFWNTYYVKSHTNYQSLFNYAPKAVSCKADNETWLIRVPSCEGKAPTFEWFSKAVQAFLSSGCKNLIIDVRGNTGGSDAMWEPIGNILVDHTKITHDSICFRNTNTNLAFYRRQLSDQTDNEWLKSFIARCESISDEFVKVEDDESDDEELPHSELPLKAAVIIDNRTASSAETLVRFVNDYCNPQRTKVYGKESTWGANKTGNEIGSILPNSKLIFYYPTCGNIPFFQQDGQVVPGIAPDVIIELPYPSTLTDNVDEWVIWVAKQLKTK